jgi:hypothetical protein
VDTIDDLLAMPSPRKAGAVGQPRYDHDPDERDRHIRLALDRLKRRMPVRECMHKYGLLSRSSVYRFIEYACSYHDDPMADLVREEWARAKIG